MSEADDFFADLDDKAPAVRTQADSFFSEIEKAPPKPEPLPPTSMGGSAARNLFDGFFANHGDELMGSAAYLLSGGDDQAYFSMRNEARKQQKADMARHPVVSTAANIVGGIPLDAGGAKVLGLFGKGSAAAKAAERATKLERLGRVVRGAGRGAAASAPVAALNAAGAADSDKLKAAAGGAAVGAGLGGIFGGSGAAIREVQDAARGGKTALAKLLRGQADITEARGAVKSAERKIQKNEIRSLENISKSPLNPEIRAAKGAEREAKIALSKAIRDGAPEAELKRLERSAALAKKARKGVMLERASQPDILPYNVAKGNAKQAKKLARAKDRLSTLEQEMLPGAQLFDQVAVRGGGIGGAVGLPIAASAVGGPFAGTAAWLAREQLKEALQNPEALRKLAGQMDEEVLKSIQRAGVFGRGGPEGQAFALKLLRDAGIDPDTARAAIAGAFSAQAGRVVGD